MISATREVSLGEMLEKLRLNHIDTNYRIQKKLEQVLPLYITNQIAQIVKDLYNEKVVGHE